MVETNEEWKAKVEERSNTQSHDTWMISIMPNNERGKGS